MNSHIIFYTMRIILAIIIFSIYMIILGIFWLKSHNKHYYLHITIIIILYSMCLLFAASMLTQLYLIKDIFNIIIYYILFEISFTPSIKRAKIKDHEQFQFLRHWYGILVISYFILCFFILGLYVAFLTFTYDDTITVIHFIILFYCIVSFVFKIILFKRPLKFMTNDISIYMALSIAIMFKNNSVVLNFIVHNILLIIFLIRYWLIRKNIKLI